jgi:pilus assembly protein CpaB
MDARRLVLALLAALLVAGGAVVAVLKFAGLNKPQQQTNDIVAAARPIGAGSVLTKDDLTTIQWPVNLPLTGKFAKANLDDLVKDQRVVLYPLDISEPILEHDLAISGSGIGLVTKIPSGMRAVSVRSNEVVGVAGFLYPGSHVDVLASFRPVEGNALPVTQTILQDVEVITAGQKSQPDPSGKPETVNVVTLLLNPVDAEKLILATNQATIQFVLRNGADKDKPQTKPVSTYEMMGATPPPKQTNEVAQQVAVRRTRPRIERKDVETPKATETVKVEIYKGEAKTEQIFPSSAVPK